MSRSYILAIVLPISIFLLSSCGVAQHTIRNNDTPNITTAATKNTKVYIRNITDSRKFVLNNDNPYLEQLASVENIDPVIVSKATAQARGVSGGVVSDIFTEKKIIDNVKEAIKERFQPAGFSVSNAETNAIPIDVNIIRFWSYNTGTWVFNFHFDISVDLVGDLAVLKAQKNFSSTITKASALGAGPRQYRNTISKGIDKFIRELAAQLTTDI